MSATASVSVEVADVNDNAPAFAQPEYTVFVKENNPPGCHIFTVSARDADAQENALVSYSLVERRVGERALSSYVSVHAESGKVYALQPLDHEELELLQFQVSARDAGMPPLAMADGPAGLRLSRLFYRDEKGAHAVGQSHLLESVTDLMTPAARFFAGLVLGKKKPPRGAKVEEQYCTALPPEAFAVQVTLVPGAALVLLAVTPLRVRGEATVTAPPSGCRYRSLRCCSSRAPRSSRC